MCGRCSQGDEGRRVIDSSGSHCETTKGLSSGESLFICRGDNVNATVTSSWSP